jgi:hypothetical protein
MWSGSFATLLTGMSIKAWFPFQRSMTCLKLEFRCYMISDQGDKCLVLIPIADVKIWRFSQSTGFHFATFSCLYPGRVTALQEP